jgi:uncharacterized protein involved in type VI secretion and phage assembly
MKAIAELHSPSGKDLEFLQLEAEEAISQPFTYRVLARSNNPDIGCIDRRRPGVLRLTKTVRPASQY